jgi:SAM-dependent methyltransferase
VGRTPNICAGPFGALYSFYIERPWLTQAIGRALWGIDTSVLYDSMGLLAEIGDGSTVLDVPCGGGVAFRALPSGTDVCYVAIDIDERMLARARERALRRGLSRVEFVAGDMLALPFDDGGPTWCSPTAACTWSATPSGRCESSRAASSQAGA